MKISNRTYDILKWIALVALPAFQVFWLTVGKVWGFPYLTEIGATIGAIGLLIATLIKVSGDNFEDGAAIGEDDVFLEDGDDNE